ncbi:hypothetical protein [Shewanella vesiculosa]|uniref:hypothetical protein n=1 Tax=Shewanella vesiculosa TaxID=518738 RepID=UPI00384B2AC0
MKHKKRDELYLKQGFSARRYQCRLGEMGGIARMIILDGDLAPTVFEAVTVN